MRKDLRKSSCWLLTARIVLAFIFGSIVFHLIHPSSSSSSSLSATHHETSKNHAGATCTHPDITAVLDCLSLTTPNMTAEELEYPSDALDHFHQIHKVMGEFTTKAKVLNYNGFTGPWMENVWISMSWERINESMDGGIGVRSTSSCSPLVNTFGPCIPLLIPWVDIWVDKDMGGKWQYPQGFFERLGSVLRSNVSYVTVSQNAEGLAAREKWTAPDNLLVFSAGGYGHVPIPLIQQDEPLWKEHRNATNRTYFMSYVGSLHHDKLGLRGGMDKFLKRKLGNEYTQYYERGGDWRSIMKDSWISMTPRGYGRTAFHVYEALQMGVVPVYLYGSTKWLPYGDLFDTLGFSTTYEDFVGRKGLVSILKSNLTTDHILAREDRIATFRESHFSKDGVVRQIFAFLAPSYWPSINSDLVCEALPATVL